MYANTETAVRDICALFVNAWKESGNPLPAAYPGSKFDIDGLTAASVWARWDIQHTTRGQASLSNVNGARRWRATGLITVETYSPIGKGLIAPYQIAEKVVRAYEGKRTPGDAWFRDVRMIEVGEVDKLWIQINVFIDFNYDILA